MNTYTSPHSTESEAVVLASCMLENDTIHDILSNVTKEDFYYPQNAQIFEAIQELEQNKKPIDIANVTNFSNEIDIKYLVHICNSIVTTTSYKHHLETIQKKSILRKVIKLSDKIKNECYEPRAELDTILENVEKELFSYNRIIEKEVATISESLENALEQLESRYNNKGSINGLSTGFKSLDAKTGGLQKGELYIIAGRPSMGKTSLAENIASNIAIQQQRSVLFFSMEMKKERIVDRMISNIGMIDSHKLRNGQLDENDWEQVAKLIGIIGNGKMFIDDTANLKAMDIKAKARRLHAKNNIELIVVDHLTEMWRPMSGKDVQEHEHNVRELKRLATELNIPVILLQQLNRGVEHRADKRPILSDLKETGASEEVADVVMLLYRDEYYNTDTEDKNIAEVIIAKGRNIGTGTIHMSWLPQFTRFGDIEYQKKTTQTETKTTNKRNYREWA